MTRQADGGRGGCSVGEGYFGLLTAPGCRDSPLEPTDLERDVVLADGRERGDDQRGKRWYFGRER